MHIYFATLAAALLIGLTPLARAVANEPHTTLPQSPRETVAAVLEDLSVADSPLLNDLIATTNTDEELLQSALATELKDLGAFSAAMTTRYAGDAAGKWGVAPVSPTLTPLSEAADKAVVRMTVQGSTRDIELVRRKNSWKITFAGLAAILAQRQVEPLVPTDEPVRRLRDVSEAMRVVTAAVRNGEYPTADAAAAAARTAWTETGRGAHNQ